MTKKLLPFFLLLCLLISGCSHSPTVVNEPPVSSTPQTNEGAEPSVSELSDRELIILTAESDAIVDWYNGPPMYSSYRPTEMGSLFHLITDCEPFHELVTRYTVIISLHEYSPAIIEEYLKDESPENQIKGIYLAELVKEVCPEISSLIDNILAEYK
jgi:hypothetical protein